MGGVREPSSGSRLNEDVFIVKGDAKASQGNKVERAKDLLWLAEFYQASPELAGTAIDAAAEAAPKSPEAVAAQLAHWISHQGAADVATWKQLLERIRRDYSYHTEIMAQVQDAQTKHVFPRQTTAQNEMDLKREAKVAAKAASDGAGANAAAIASSIKRTAEASQQRGDYTAVHSIYKKALKEHSDNKLFFIAMAPDYFNLCKNEPSQAKTCVTAIENLAEREVGTRGGDFFDAKKKADAWKLLQDMWMNLGETKKAGKVSEVVAALEEQVRSARTTNGASDPN
jgi:hypothetical protein